MHLVLPESADTWKQEIIEFAKYYGFLVNLRCFPCAFRQKTKKSKFV